MHHLFARVVQQEDLFQLEMMDIGSGVLLEKVDEVLRHVKCRWRIRFSSNVKSEMCMEKVLIAFTYFHWESSH